MGIVANNPSSSNMSSMMYSNNLIKCGLGGNGCKGIDFPERMCEHSKFGKVCFLCDRYLRQKENGS